MHLKANTRHLPPPPPLPPTATAAAAATPLPCECHYLVLPANTTMAHTDLSWPVVPISRAQYKSCFGLITSTLQPMEEQKYSTTQHSQTRESVTSSCIRSCKMTSPSRKKRCRRERQDKFLPDSLRVPPQKHYDFLPPPAVKGC